MRTDVAEAVHTNNDKVHVSEQCKWLLQSCTRTRVLIRSEACSLPLAGCLDREVTAYRPEPMRLLKLLGQADGMHVMEVMRCGCGR